MAGRSDSERMELARQCVKIERSGGNVIEFLKKNGAPYTPSATWHNLQKYYLKRRADQMTTGIPKEEKRKEEPEVEKTKGSRINSRTLAEELGSVVILNGGDPVEHLREMGYVNPAQKWRQLRKVMQEKNRDLLEQMDLALAARQEKKDTFSEPQKGPQEPAEDQTDEYPSETPEAQQRQNGVETARGSQRKITTCCAPARESGVTVPDEIPEEVVEYNGKEYERAKPEKKPDEGKKLEAYSRIEQISESINISSGNLNEVRTPAQPAEPETPELCVKSLESRIGSFAKGSRMSSLGNVQVMSFVSDDLCSTVRLTPEEWGILLATAPKALRMLGLIK